MRKLIVLLLCLESANTNAEVFKCIEKYGKTVYQASPCNTASKELQLDIKSDPGKDAEAKAKLDAIRNEYDTRKIAQEKADKELAEQQRAAAALEYARRNAIAQQEQAQAQQRQAEAMERQNGFNNRPGYFFTPIVPARPLTPYPPAPHPLPGRNRLNP